MLAAFKRKIILLVQLLLVITFIIFEEVIWEGIARPIYTYVHGLKLLQQIEVKVQQSNPLLVLSVFVILLVMVELFGVYAGVLFISGHLILGTALYLSKVPIAAFTFWLFKVSEEKLMQFGWFRWTYEKIMAIIDWLKSCEVYVETMEKLKSLKAKVKKWFSELKAKYFAKESLFVMRLKKLYQSIKTTLRRHQR
jgi:hypothetical protein